MLQGVLTCTPRVQCELRCTGIKIRSYVKISIYRNEHAIIFIIDMYCTVVTLYIYESQNYALYYW